jgi:hypothetical protein
LIRMLQVLCGPARHAICGILYNDKDMPPQKVREGLEALIEGGTLRRRCEICDAPKIQFQYEDRPTTEQDWDKAKAMSEQLEAQQMHTRKMVMAARKAAKN